MNYTKGDWKVTKGKENINWIEYSVGIYYGEVCTVRGTINSMVDWLAPGSQAKDNANLIAASPDIYEALNLVLQWWRHGDEGDMPISIEVACDKALAIAEGREV
jgi:hypothetical protein